MNLFLKFVDVWGDESNFAVRESATLRTVPRSKFLRMKNVLGVLHFLFPNQQSKKSLYFVIFIKCISWLKILLVSKLWVHLIWIPYNEQCYRISQVRRCFDEGSQRLGTQSKRSSWDLQGLAASQPQLGPTRDVQLDDSADWKVSIEFNEN